MIFIITQGEQGFGRVWLKFLRIFQSSFGRIPASGGPVATVKVQKRVRSRKSCPSEREIGIEVYRLLIKIDGFPRGIEGEDLACFKSQAAKIGIISIRIVCRFNC